MTSGPRFLAYLLLFSGRSIFDLKGWPAKASRRYQITEPVGKYGQADQLLRSLARGTI